MTNKKTSVSDSILRGAGFAAIVFLFVSGLNYTLDHLIPKLPLSCMERVTVSVDGSSTIYTVEELDMSWCE